MITMRNLKVGSSTVAIKVMSTASYARLGRWIDLVSVGSVELRDSSCLRHSNSDVGPN